jgi:DNA-binding transcriptional regulator GbsR (MarR family)
MRQEIAKEQILNFWEEKKETWNKGDHNAFYESAQNFFHWLESEKPELLNFKCNSDKWQVVKGWINVQEDYPHC